MAVWRYMMWAVRNITKNPQVVWCPNHPESMAPHFVKLDPSGFFGCSARCPKAGLPEPGAIHDRDPTPCDTRWTDGCTVHWDDTRWWRSFRFWCWDRFSVQVFLDKYIISLFFIDPSPTAPKCQNAIREVRGCCSWLSSQSHSRIFCQPNFQPFPGPL